MRILFRGFLLLLAFMIAIAIVKIVFVKLFMLALWVGAIALVIFLVSSLLKKPST